MAPMKIGKFANLYAAYLMSHVRPRAMNVRMIPTDKCNLNCGYCWQKRQESHEMTMEEFRTYLAKAKSLGVGLVTFLGGEPMTWEHIYDAIADCSRAHVLTDLTTNGTLLNEESIWELGESGLDYLNISVDTAVANQVTAKNSIFREGVMGFLQEARQRFGMHYRINAVIYKGSFETVKGLLEFAKASNVQISLGYVVPPIEGMKTPAGDIYFSQEDAGLLREMVDYIIAKRRSGYPVIDPEEYFEGIFRFLRKEKFWNCNYPTRYGWVNVAPDGRIRSCTKKMDELDYRFMELDGGKLLELRKLLAGHVKECNVHCYSNCAFDSWFYTHNKRAFLAKIADRVKTNHRANRLVEGREVH
jgi:MoaA/NifB/PqqE/SkfB family radical SAM enzyme